MTRSAPSAEQSGITTEGAGFEVRGLVRTFGVQRALDGLDLRLPRGTFLTLFGPNGAGKSTLLRILSGALTPSDGEILEEGEVLRTRSPEWQRRIGVLSHQTYLYPQLTARENLVFFGRMYGLDRLTERVDAGLESVGLADRAVDTVETFSRGMRQRLGLARTLLHEPSVVLLDEPFTGLDAHASAILRDALSELQDGTRTVVMVTHNLSEGFRMADTVAVQVRGRIGWMGPRSAIDDDAEVFYRGIVEASS